MLSEEAIYVLYLQSSDESLQGLLIRATPSERQPLYRGSSFVFVDGYEISNGYIEMIYDLPGHFRAIARITLDRVKFHELEKLEGWEEFVKGL